MIEHLPNLGDGDPFVETTVTREIRGALNYTIKTGIPSLITGPSGVGKTSALTQIVRENSKDRHWGKQPIASPETVSRDYTIRYFMTGEHSKRTKVCSR